MQKGVVIIMLRTLSLVSLVLPLTVAIWFAFRSKGYIKPILLGTFTFVFFQVLIRIPLLQLVLPQMDWYIVMSTNPLQNAIFLSLSAALFEECGRYIVMRLFMKKRLTCADGIAFGVGHGGVEAILFVGINSLITLIVAFNSVNPSLMMAGGFERLFAMTSHIAWSLMVLKSVRYKKVIWLIIPIVLHTAMNASAVVTQYSRFSIWVTEGILFVFAIFMGAYIINEIKNNKGELL